MRINSVKKSPHNAVYKHEVLMEKHENKSEAAALRQKAEEVLKTRTNVACSVSATEADNLKLIYELEVHQVELEMQNEVLRLSEQALKEQIEKNKDDFFFRGAILDSPSNIIIFALDKNYCYTEFTKSHKETMSNIWDIEIKIGMNLLDIISVANDRLNAKNNFDRAFRGEHFLILEEYGDPSLKRLVYENYYSPVKNSDDIVIGVSVFVIDVTDRSKLQFDMKERLKELNCHNQISDAMSNSNLSVDEVCEKIVHLIPPGWQFPDITEACIQIRDKVYQTGNFITSHRFLHQEIKIKDKAIGFLEVCLPDDKVPDANPLFLPEELNLLFSIAERLGNYVEKEEAGHVLSESKEKYAKAFHTSPYAIIISEVEDGTFLEVNDSFCSITGFTQKEALANTALRMDLWVDPDDRKRLLTKLRENGKVEGEECRFRKKNGEIMVGIFSASFIHLHHQSCIIASINDVTASRQAEEKLRASEEKFRNIFENMLDVYYEASLDGIIFEVSPSIEIISKGQYSRNELIGKSLYTLYEDPEARKLVVPELLKHGSITDYEVSLLNKDGSVMPAAFSAKLLFDSSGNPAKISGIMHDITERKKAELKINDLNENLETRIIERTIQLAETNKNLENEIQNRMLVEVELKREKQRLSDIIIGTNAGTWEWNIQTDITIIDERWAEIIGYTLDELQPVNIETWIEFLPPEDLKEALELHEKHINGELDFYSHEFRMKHKNGEWVWVLNTGKIHTWDNTGKPLLMSGTHQDITKRKRAEQALRDSEARFSLFMDYLPVIVFLKDHEGRTLFINKYMEEVFGASEWIGKTMLEVFPNEFGEKLRADDINSIQLGYQKFEESLVQLDRKLHHYETQKFTIDRSGQEPWLGGISVDITGRKRAEAEILKSQEAAEKANQAKSEFLSRMSHELRTPMNSIIGFGQLLNMGELNPKQKKSVNHILNSGKHLLDLIDEVLEISRIEAGKLVLFPEPVQLSGIISEMLDTVQPLADDRQLKLELENSPDNQLFVMSDRKLLKQVLINLLNNAVKYNRQGGSILVKTESMPPNVAGKVFVRVSVTDTGLGIHSDDILKLFVPFERIGSERTKIEGTGLGLAVVKKIMDAMEGTVGVESIVDQGSTFWIELPAAEKEMSRENQQENNVKMTANLDIANKEIVFQHKEKANRTAELVMLKKKDPRETGITVHAKTGTILYIEDNIQNAELVEEIIRDHRPEFHLITSGLGEPAVKLAIQHKPDLILLDLVLPDMDGATVMKNLLADDKTNSIPVVILTADATP